MGFAPRLAEVAYLALDELYFQMATSFDILNEMMTQPDLQNVEPQHGMVDLEKLVELLGRFVLHQHHNADGLVFGQFLRDEPG